MRVTKLIEDKVVCPPSVNTSSVSATASACCCFSSSSSSSSPSASASAACAEELEVVASDQDLTFPEHDDSDDSEVSVFHAVLLCVDVVLRRFCFNLTTVLLTTVLLLCCFFLRSRTSLHILTMKKTLKKRNKRLPLMAMQKTLKK